MTMHRSGRRWGIEARAVPSDAGCRRSATEEGTDRMSKARPRLSAKATLIGAFAVFIALLLAGIATAEKPVKVRAGNLELTFNGGFHPNAVPEHNRKPRSLTSVRPT